jgi:hypothetical protein
MIWEEKDIEFKVSSALCENNAKAVGQSGGFALATTAPMGHPGLNGNSSLLVRRKLLRPPSARLTQHALPIRRDGISRHETFARPIQMIAGAIATILSHSEPPFGTAISWPILALHPSNLKPSQTPRSQNLLGKRGNCHNFRERN